MSKTIDYYLSTSSPWTYFGSQRFTAMAAEVGAEVNVYPVNFGAIFAVSGGLPLPKRAPQRQAYRMMELQRWKRRLGVPIVIQPQNFPSTDPISAQAVIAAREAGADALGLSNALLAALWEDDRNIDDADTVAAVVAEAGLDADPIMASATSDTIAEMFRSDTEAAITRGVFGAPSYVIDEEIFWGQDRLEFVAEALGVG